MISEFNKQPGCTPVNASTRRSPDEPHYSRPRRLARSYPVRLLHSLPFSALMPTLQSALNPVYFYSFILMHRLTCPHRPIIVSVLSRLCFRRREVFGCSSHAVDSSRVGIHDGHDKTRVEHRVAVDLTSLLCRMELPSGTF